VIKWCANLFDPLSIRERERGVYKGKGKRCLKGKGKEVSIRERERGVYKGKGKRGEICFQPHGRTHHWKFFHSKAKEHDTPTRIRHALATWLLLFLLLLQITQTGN
jgi:hypothetical protein